MKRHIDLSIKDDPKLQEFLQWIDRKTHSVEARYKPAAIRAYYCAIDPTIDPTLYLAAFLDSAFDSALALAIDLDLDYQLAFALDVTRPLHSVLDLAVNLDQSSEFQRQLKQLSDRHPDTSPENQENFEQ